MSGSLPPDALAKLGALYKKNPDDKTTVLYYAAALRTSGQAEQAVAPLQAMAPPTSLVIRDGHEQRIPAEAIVPGDILLITEGDAIDADGRLASSAALTVAEASLTGESEPVLKDVETLRERAPLGDRTNMVFSGTAVTRGHGLAIVTATGMATEVGRIATLLETATSGETPLQRRLDRVARRLVWACLAIVAVVFALGWLRGTSAFELFITSISLAVAAVPEGLPAVVTIALALGVERMVRRNALVRRMPSVETLGSAQVICTDKTGTLTQNRMQVRSIYVPGEMTDRDGTMTRAGFAQAHRRFLECALHCHDLKAAAGTHDPCTVDTSRRDHPVRTCHSGGRARSGSRRRASRSRPQARH